MSCKIYFNVLSYVFILFIFNLHCVVSIRRAWRDLRAARKALVYSAA